MGSILKKLTNLMVRKVYDGANPLLTFYAGDKIKKKCTRCNKIKDTRAFAIDKKRKDGLQSKCRKCQKELSGKHYLNNKDKYTYSRHKYRNKNPVRTWCSCSLSNHRVKYNVILTLDELNKIALKSNTCIYCGRKLEYSHQKRGVSKPDSPTLDRINNEKIINKNNVQIICRECNTTKGARTHEEFIKYCNKISNNFCAISQDS